MKIFLLNLLVAAVLSGCALQYRYFPEPYPDDLKPAAKAGQFISAQAPVLETHYRFLGVSYAKWTGPDVTFSALSFCPWGYPTETENEKCVQTYWGVKVDGSESIMLQAKQPGRWVWVFLPKEQSAFRYIELGPISPYNMAGGA